MNEVNIGPVRGPSRKTIAIIGADAVLDMDLRLMLEDAGFEPVSHAFADLLPETEGNWASAIVDYGRGSERILQGLARLTERRIPHIIISCVHDDLPEATRSSQMRAHLNKPICVNRVLSLL